MFNFRAITLALALAVGLTVLAAAPVATAKGGPGVRVRGTCTQGSTAKLKLSGEDGRIEIEFEVGCRRWNYDRLGWGDSKRASIGQRIFESAERGGLTAALKESRALFQKERGNPDWNFGLFEYMKCAGRLDQRDRPREGAAVLAQAIELKADSTAAADMAVVRCQRAELLLRAGDRVAARDELTRAESADSSSTYVRALKHSLGI